MYILMYFRASLYISGGRMNFGVSFAFCIADTTEAFLAVLIPIVRVCQYVASA
jgi:hypothetical protein